MGSKLETIVGEVEMREYKKAIILPDLHVPYQDDKALELVYKFIKDFKPDTVIQLGDFYDFYDISRFDKDPSRKLTIQQEIDIGYPIWQKLKKNAPNAEFVMLEGNHERRLYKYLMKNPELFSIRALNIEKLLDLKELGVKFYRAEETYMLNKTLMVTHGANDDGCKLSQYSAYSAKNNLAKNNISAISGHTHRMGTHYRSDYSGMKGWWEAGCLCDLHPSYVKNPDWHQSIAVVHYTSNRYNVQLIPIINYKMFYGDKEYFLKETKK